MAGRAIQLTSLPSSLNYCCVKKYQLGSPVSGRCPCTDPVSGWATPNADVAPGATLLERTTGWTPVAHDNVGPRVC